MLWGLRFSSFRVDRLTSTIYNMSSMIDKKNRPYWILGGILGSLLVAGLIIQFTDWDTWVALTFSPKTVTP